MEAGERLGPQEDEEVLEFEHRVSEPEATAKGPRLAENQPRKEQALPGRTPMLDRLGALVTILDRQGRVRWVNRLCEETTGLSFEDVWGRPVWEVLVPPEEGDRVRDALANLGTGRFTRGYESRLPTREGASRIIQWSTAPLLNGEGPVEHIISVGIDITDRKLAEDRLRKSEEHYRHLVESSPDAILGSHCACCSSLPAARSVSAGSLPGAARFWAGSVPSRCSAPERRPTWPCARWGSGRRPP